MLALSPRVAVEIFREAIEGARQGVWSNASVAPILDAERVHRILPDTGRGVTWFPPDEFLSVLLPRVAPSDQVLELGCGAGRVTRLVAPHVMRLTATDPTKLLLDDARRNLAQLPNVDVRRVDRFLLSEFDDASFDVAFGQGVFSFLDPNPALVLLDEVRRVLRAGGRSVFNFFTIDRPAWAAWYLSHLRASAARKRFSGGDPRAYTEGQIRALHEAVGLRVVDATYGVGEPTSHRPLIVVAEAIGRPGG